MASGHDVAGSMVTEGNSSDVLEVSSSSWRGGWIVVLPKATVTFETSSEMFARVPVTSSWLPETSISLVPILMRTVKGFSLEAISTSALQQQPRPS